MFLLIISYSYFVNQAVAKTLRELRKRYQISQEQLADAIESHQVYISEIEQGKKLPSLTILKKMAACFNMSLTDLVNQIENNDGNSENK